MKKNEHAEERRRWKLLEVLNVDVFSLALLPFAKSCT